MASRRVERRFERYRRTGDPAALAYVFDATAPEILRVAAHLARDPAAAEDLLQRTFVTAIEAAASWDRSQRLVPWLLGILSNHAKEAARKSARTPDPARVVPPAEAADPATAAANRESTDTALRAIDDLPDPARSVLVLRYRHGLEPAEIALALGMAPATVRSHLHRGVARIRKTTAGALAGAALTAFVPTRGLDSIRRAVLAHATAHGPVVAATAGIASATSIVIGGVMGKKAITVAAVLVALGSGAAIVVVNSSDSASSPSTAPRVLPSPAATPSLAARPAADASKATAAVDERPVVSAATGDLEVRVLLRGGSALVDEPFHLLPLDEETPWAYRLGRTGADGVGRMRSVEPGRRMLYSARGMSTRVDVVAGTTVRAEITPHPSVDVEGVVVDGAGAPVEGASIWIDVFNSRSFQMAEITKSDANGRFVVESVDRGASVFARKSGRAPSPCRRLQSETGRVERIRLILGGSGADVVGRVVDAAGSPLAAAIVLVGSPLGFPVDLPDGTQGTTPAPVLLVTDADGRFSADGLSLGKTLVTVRARGFAPYRNSEGLDATAPSSPWTITLSRATPLEGTVVDESGALVEGADVRSTAGADPLVRFEARTDSAGRFRLDDLVSESGDWGASFDVTHATKGKAYFAVGKGAGPWEPRSRIVLRTHAPIRVRLVDESGAPVASADIAAVSSNAPWGKARAKTDAEGRATLDVGDSDRYRIALVAQGGPPGQPLLRSPILKAGADEMPVVVRQADRPTARISVRVLGPEGSPPEAARVYAMPLGGSMGLNFDADGATGRTESPRLLAGVYDVVLNAANYGSVPLGRVRVDAGQSLDMGTITLARPGALVVHVAGAEQNAAIGAAVRTWTERGVVWARIEKDERARFFTLQPGSYRVVVDGWWWKKPVMAAVTATADVVAGAQATLELALVPGVARAIRLEGLSDEEWPGTSVVVHAAGDDAPLALFSVHDTAERVDLTVALSPGHYVAEGRTREGRRATVSFEIKADGEPPVVLAFER